MSARLRPFKSLYFGDAAAEDEAEKWPDLFLKSFYDIRGAGDLIASGDAFLLIGPKGAGKSSYVEYLRLKGRTQYNQFVRREDLGELRGILKTDATLSDSGVELTEMAWSTWIWCRLLDSIMQDQGSSAQSNPEVVGLYRELQHAGVVSGSFPEVVREVRKKQHKFTVPKFYEFATESTGAKKANIIQLRDLLASIVISTATSNMHILALDGLDSAEIGTDAYWKQLSALLRACTSIHRQLRGARSSIRIALLIRSDVFLKIPIPDSNKIRQGWGVELEWSYGLETPEDSPLWDLLEKKTSARGPLVQNLVDLYFPPNMKVGARTNRRQIPMHRYLIELTRNTPRDMVMLMKNIQGQLLPDQDLDVRRVRAGVNAYCRNYFAGEIGNELVGMVPDDVARVVVGSMSRLPGRGFTRQQFFDVFNGIMEDNRLVGDNLLQQLYLAGAIANAIPTASETYVRFYHRRSYVELDLRGPFILHNALTLSLNLPWANAYDISR